MEEPNHLQKVEACERTNINKKTVSYSTYIQSHFPPLQI